MPQTRSLRALFYILSLTLAALTVTSTAAAEGYEFPALGAKPLGRGGAVHVAIDDPLAILYNPSNLAVLGRRDPGRTAKPFQAQLDLNLVFFDACYQRKSSPNNNYGDVTVGTEPTVFGDHDEYAGQAWPTACNEGPPNPIPTALIAWNPEDLPFGFAFGLVVPHAVGITKWADTNTDTVTVGGRQLPAGHRFMTLSQEALFLSPSIGVGWDLGDVRLGATFQWGLALVKFNNHTAEAAVQGENPDNSVGTELDVSDMFVPGLILSATAEPIENLEMMVGFHWQDSVRASGEILFTSGVYGAGDEATGTRGKIPTDSTVTGVGFESPQPWTLQFGLRYAETDPAHGDRELWDIELDLRYSRSSVVDEFVITIPQGEGIVIPRIDSDGEFNDTLQVNPPENNRVAHNWRDQFAARLGGDVLVVPELLQARAGVSFESSGVTPAYAQLDFWPVARLGLHAGLTLQLGDFDVSIAYAHMFNETVTAEPDEADVRQLVAVGRNPVAINGGIYASNIDIVSLGVVWRP